MANDRKNDAVSDSDAEPESSLGRRRANAHRQGSPKFLATRAKLLVSAGQVFREHGVSRMSLQDIADRAGFDRATIYYYFASKEALFSELIRDVMVGNVEMAESIASSADGPEAKLRRIICELMKSFSLHDPYAALYVEEFLPRTEATAAYTEMDELRELAKRFDRAVASVVRDGYEAGVFRRFTDERSVAFMLIGMVNSSVRWLKQPDVELSVRTAEHMCDLVLGGLIEPAKRSAKDLQ